MQGHHRPAHRADRRPLFDAVLIEEGYDSRREIYTMTVAEVLEHLDSVVNEAKELGAMPTLPVIA